MAHSEKPTKFWFVLEKTDGEEGRPWISERSFEVWGNLPIPVYDKTAFTPAYERPSMDGTKYHQNEATVTLQYAHIRQAAIDAGRLEAHVNDEYWEKLASISFPGRLGRILLHETEGSVQS